MQEGTKPWSQAKAELEDPLAQGAQAARQGLRAVPAAVRPRLPGHRGGQRSPPTSIRNVWSHAVIFCGHFPDGTETFDEERLDGETKGQWYVRQMLGSANLSGGPLFHIMTGNLSHQIEHHLFPDLPSNRYAEIAPRVREICERYGLPYTTGPLPRQYGKVLRTIFRLVAAWRRTRRPGRPLEVLAPAQDTARGLATRRWLVGALGREPAADAQRDGQLQPRPPGRPARRRTSRAARPAGSARSAGARAARSAAAVTSPCASSQARSVCSPRAAAPAGSARSGASARSRRSAASSGSAASSRASRCSSARASVSGEPGAAARPRAAARPPAPARPTGAPAPGSTTGPSTARRPARPARSRSSQPVRSGAGTSATPTGSRSAPTAPGSRAATATASSTTSAASRAGSAQPGGRGHPLHLGRRPRAGAGPAARPGRAGGPAASRPGWPPRRPSRPPRPRRSARRS